ncbi:MAG TPA: FUSC family protein [Candidatus Acidoferrum sp.]|nr:FUSC family protein [Candidatus Acidoferrum sp.]
MSTASPPLSAQQTAATASAAPVPPPNHASPTQSFWRVLTKFDHTKVSVYRALRNAAGVALPLIAGYALGMPRGGLVVASGALNVSYSDGSDPYARRGKRMAGSALLCAVAVFAGAISGPHSALAIVMATGWAFAAGMMVALGTTAADLGVISLVSLLIYAAQPLTAQQAAVAGILALVGGLFQAALSVALWPVQRYEPERRALAKFFTQLANTAEAPTSATVAPPASLESDEAQAALTDLGEDTSVEAVRFRSLLNQSERIRLSILMLARLRLRMERESAGHGAIAIVEEVLQKAALALRAVAGLLTSDNFSNARIDFADLRRFSQQLADTARQSPSSFFTAVAKDAAYQIDALGGQLRAVTDLAAHSTTIGQEAFDQEEARQPWWLQFSGWYATLRANFSLGSSAFRHAIRLTVMVAIGETLGRGFYWQRSYWLPMTVVLVLKPEFTSTFSRGLLRVAGTIVGLLLATALFHFLPINVTSQILLIFVFTFLLRWIGPANYGIFGIAVSALVVLLIAIAGIAPKDVIWARGINTAGGGVLALLAYWVWPTWEHTRVWERLALMLEAYRAYFHALSAAYVSGGADGESEIARTRSAARVARSNLEGSIERLASEPGTTPQQLTRLSAVVASSHRFIHAVMALDAGWMQTAKVPARPPFKIFAEDVEKTLSLLVAALRGARVADKDFPNLREDHNRLVEFGDSKVQRYALVDVEGDRITNSLNTLREQILDWSRSQQ